MPTAPTSAMPPATPTLERFVTSKLFQNAILGVIVVNAVVLGLQTAASLQPRYGRVLATIDQLCLALFVLELVLKLTLWRLRFFRSAWNVFDFLVVAISFVPGAKTFSVLRALRVMRVMRLLSSLPSLRRVVNGLVRALPGMASVILLMAVIFYVGSVIATTLFGKAFPEWFGTIGASAYSLFQIMTLESWSMGIVRPVMVLYPAAWAFFVPFIITTSFAVMNLIVGLVVTAMQDAQHEEDTQDARTQELETVAFQTQVLERLAQIERSLNR